MNNELLSILEYLEHERGIDRETLMSLVEESVMSAAHKAIRFTNDLHIRMDHQTGDIQAWAKLTVVGRVKNR